jgi:uncharacterized Zn-binding protein involved in type VI secretion
MKKALSFAVALGLVAGVASVASAAELSINGDARWRGVYKDNTVFSSDKVADRAQTMDQRYRFNCNLKINDDVTVNTRLVLRDGEFGNDNGASDFVDRANMVIKMLGGTWTIGRQDVSWGNKFLAWGESSDRIKGIYKSGDITYGGFLQKDKEDSLAQGNGDGDKTTYAGVFIMKAGDTTFGVLPVYTTDDSNAAKASGKDTGYLIDPYFVTKIGPATVMGEFVYQGGDLNENTAGDAIWGGFVGGQVDMAPITVKGLVAIWDGNQGATGKRDCDNDFAPSVLIGTCNETAVIKFGGTTSTADDSTLLVGAGVDFKASDKLTVGGLVGYLDATENGYQGDNATLIELDLTAKYALAQNANYTIGVAYAMPDKFSADDDEWLVIGNRIEVNW